MRRLLVALFLTCLPCFPAAAQDSFVLEKPCVNRNMELMSIVWRLAGKPEYSSTHFKLYTDRIEEHFGEYKSHEIIGFVQSIIRDNGISYDAVASMAVHLDEELNLRTDVAAGSLEGRWAKVDKERFVSLLKEFAADTEADRFFDDNAELYAEASRRFIPVCEALDLDWYAGFFGIEPKGKFLIFNGLGMGSGNYGISARLADGTEEIYAVIGAWSVDEMGMAVFPMGEYIVILLHEFNHSFVNHITARHREAFRDSGEMFFAAIKQQMRAQAYSSWETMLNEALVRAAVIKYMKDHGADPASVGGLVQMEKRRGFGWIEPLVAELDKYAAAREEYPTLDDYMPRLAEAYRGWAEIVAARQAAAN